MAPFELVIEGAAEGEGTFPFPGMRFLIGSSPECHLVFDSKLVKGRHAEITVDDQDRAWLKDLTGSSLVWVNGQPAQSTELVAGSAIKLGGLSLVVRARAVDPARRKRAVTPEPAPLEELEYDGPTVLEQIVTPGTVIHGRYRVIDKLASGGMGDVYKAEHVELGKPLAIKVMKRTRRKDPEFATRFKREAIAASRIGQQNIIDISDFGQTEGGAFFFVMELVDGVTLTALVRQEGAQPVGRTLAIAVQIGRALAAAHALGIVHRDLKPDNVMLLQRPGQPDFVKVLDFGVAKVTTDEGSASKTSVGMIIGTPQYMSPEQARGLTVDARSDVYALGLILYELLSGRPVFAGETPSVLIMQQVTEAPPPLTAGPGQTIPQALEALIFTMLAKPPEERPATMTEVVTRLEALIREEQQRPSTAVPVPAPEPVPAPAPRSTKTPAPVAPPRSGKTPLPAGATEKSARTPSPGVLVGRSGRTPWPEAVAGRAVATPAPKASEAPVDLPPPAVAPALEETLPPLVAPKSRTPLYAGAAVVLVAGALAALVWPSSQAPAPEAPVVNAPTPAPLTPVAALPAEPPAAKPREPEAPTVASPQAPPAPVKYEVHLTTTPEKAEVYSGDELLGVTPLTLSREENTQLSLRFTLKGYREQKRKLRVSATTEVPVALEKEARPLAPARPSAPAPAHPAAPPPPDDLKPAPF